MNSPRSPRFPRADNDISALDGILYGGEEKSAAKHEPQRQSALDRYAVLLLTQTPNAQAGNAVDFMNKSGRSKCSSTSSQF